MLFSVVIPTYNRVDLLIQTLNSVWTQTFTDFEVLVVDDGSTDGTMERLQAFGERVKVISQLNQGPGAARNLGVKHSKGDYIAFLDSDDLWFPWTLSCYKSVIEANDQPSFLAGKPLRFTNEIPTGSVSEEKTKTACFLDYLASGKEWRWWGVSSFIIKRTAFDSSGGFATKGINAEDADLALRLGIAKGFVQITVPYTFAYRDHAANVTKDLDRTLAGVKYGLACERAGRYPGGRDRSLERWRILTRHTRPVSLECLCQKRRREGWQLYWTIFRGQLRLGGLKYLFGFPLKAILSYL